MNGRAFKWFMASLFGGMVMMGLSQTSHAFDLGGALKGAAQQASQGSMPTAPAAPTSLKDMAMEAVKGMVQQKLQATGLPFGGEDVANIVDQVTAMAKAGKVDMANGSQLAATVGELVLKWAQGR